MANDLTLQPKTKFIILLIAVAVLIVGFLSFVFPWQWVNQPVHSFDEGVGAVFGLVLAILLLSRKGDEYLIEYRVVSAALIGMGVLDLMHAFFAPGEVFVWLHSVATFVGGLLFSLVWFARKDSLLARLSGILPVLVFILSTAAGAISVFFPEILPKMLSAGAFTVAASWLNVIGGLFFAVAGIFFFLRYRAGKQADVFFLSVLCFVFAMSGIVFPFSVLWSASWWYWHFLRLLAYIFVFVYAFVILPNLKIKTKLFFAPLFISAVFILSAMFLFSSVSETLTDYQLVNVKLQRVDKIDSLLLGLEKTRRAVGEMLVGEDRAEEIINLTRQTDMVAGDVLDLSEKVKGLLLDQRVSGVEEKNFTEEYAVARAGVKPLFSAVMDIIDLHHRSLFDEAKEQYESVDVAFEALDESLKEMSDKEHLVADLFVVGAASRQKQFAYLFLSGSSLIVLVSLIFSAIVNAGLSKRIGQFKDSAKKIIAGDTSKIIDVGTGDEIGELAESFNVVVARLQSAIGTIEHKTRTEYEKIINSTPLCIKQFDLSGKLVFLNSGGREEHSIKENDDLSEWNWFDSVEEKYRLLVEEKFKKALAGETELMEFKHKPGISKHEWCSGIISPIKDESGKVLHVLFYSTDITAIKMAEFKAKESEEMFRALLDATPMCIKWFDATGKLISVNRGGRKEHHLEKMSEEEVKNWDYMGSVKKEYQEEVKNKMALALQGVGSAIEFEHVPGTAESEWCYSILTPVLSEDGKVKYVLFMSRDVTDEKKVEQDRQKNYEKAEETKEALYNILEDVKVAERESRIQKNRLQTILSSIGEGLFVVDNELKIILTNRKAEEVVGVKEDRMIGKSIKSLVGLYIGDKNADDYSEGRPVERALSKGETVVVNISDDYYYRLPIGKKIPVEIVTSPLFGEEKKIIGAVIVFRDVSYEKALDESKNSFISIASHQLRTPLTSIRWYAEMLDSGDAGPLNADQKDFVGKVYGGVLRLGEVINLLLTLSRIESGRAEFERTDINVVEFVAGAIKDLEPQWKAKTLSVKIAGGEQELAELPKIKYDASILRQIVSNVLSNSIRYTNTGGKIEVSFKKMPGEIVFCVKDDGIGIPADQRDKIFSKFFRAANAVSKVPDGSGLGLSLVKALVVANKGHVWFESPTTWANDKGEMESKGTMFYFTVPIEKN